jgi:hypothetical protein
LNERDQIQLQSVARSSTRSTPAGGSGARPSRGGGTVGVAGGSKGVKRPGSTLENNVHKK